jgi:hypothetical protein
VSKVRSATTTRAMEQRDDKSKNLRYDDNEGNVAAVDISLTDRLEVRIEDVPLEQVAVMRVVHSVLGNDDYYLRGQKQAAHHRKHDEC